MTRAAGLLACAALAACLPVEDDPRLVDRLRVLSIRADPPEGPPGTPVLFTALAAHPSGEAPRLQWLSCDAARPTARSPGPGGDCLLSEGAARLLGEGDSLSFDMPRRWLEGLKIENQVAGVNFRVYLVATHGEERVEAYKTFRISLNPYANRNPEIAGATAGDAEALDATVTVAPASDLKLQAVAAEGSEEHLEITTPDGQMFEIDEDLTWDWFSDTGSFRGGAIGYRAGRDLGANLDAVWTAPPTAGPARIWVVVRDGRGGNAFREIAVEVK